MKATAFEQRHAALLRLCIYATAFSAYFLDPDDIVWRLIRDSPSRRALEHAAFLMATLMIGAGARLCTLADAYASDPQARRRTRGALLGDWLYAVGMSTLAPLWGCVILVGCESLRILRLTLAGRHDEHHATKTPQWRDALRRQAARWGVLVTMGFFTITLIDRVADYGIAASVTLWAALNGAWALRRSV